MKKYNDRTVFFVPDGKTVSEALKRTTHLGIVAHHDDLEIAAYHGILECFMKEDKWFTGVVVTDGGGSARGGFYAKYSDEAMRQVRIQEQKKAAMIGEYGLQAFFNAPSSQVKDPKDTEVVDEMVQLILDTKPEIIYTHNLADKHDTHIGIVTKVIKAIRKIAPNERPKKLYGCEVWRDLDWLLDDEKVRFNVGGKPNLAQALVEVFDSQIDGSKRYDLAAIGRRLAHATFSDSHAIDASDSVIYGMDLTPLIKDDALDVKAFILAAIDRFKDDVAEKINRIGS